MTVVIDASFAVHIGGGGGADDAPAADAVDLTVEGLIAPPIFWHEVANAFRRLRHQRVVTQAAATAGLRALRNLRIVLEPATADILPVVAVSDAHQLSVYDAAYLELALRTGARLATRDRALRAAAARAGVVLA